MAKFDNSDFKGDKLPTLLQYRKQGKLKAKQYTVLKVWLPNAFPILTLETDCFRMNIKAKTPGYESVMEEVGQCVEQEKAYFLKVVSVDDLDLETLILDGEECDWRELGEYGFIAENHRKKPVAKKTLPKSKEEQNS